MATEIISAFNTGGTDRIRGHLDGDKVYTKVYLRVCYRSDPESVSELRIRLQLHCNITLEYTILSSKWPLRKCLG